MSINKTLENFLSEWKRELHQNINSDDRRDGKKFENIDNICDRTLSLQSSVNKSSDKCLTSAHNISTKNGFGLRSETLTADHGCNVCGKEKKTENIQPLECLSRLFLPNHQEINSPSVVHQDSCIRKRRSSTGPEPEATPGKSKHIEKYLDQFLADLVSAIKL